MQDQLYLYTHSSGIIYLVRATSEENARAIIQQEFNRIDPYVYLVEWITDNIAEVT